MQEELKAVIAYAKQVIEDEGVLTVRFNPSQASNNTLELAKAFMQLLESK